MHSIQLAGKVDVARDFGWRGGSPLKCYCDAQDTLSAACIIATDHATNPRTATQPTDRVRSHPLIRLAGDDRAPGHRPRSLVASAHRAVDRGNRTRPSLRPFFLYSCRARLGVARVVVGGRVLRTLEARRRC